MADEKKNEPQSYGSQSEWVRGDVGEEVNRLKGNPNSQRGDFYESRDESDGGSVSPEQLSDNREPSEPAVEDEDKPVQGSWFKKRDYE